MRLPKADAKVRLMVSRVQSGLVVAVRSCSRPPCGCRLSPRPSAQQAVGASRSSRPSRRCANPWRLFDFDERGRLWVMQYLQYP